MKLALIDRLVTAVDSLPVSEQPVCWFLAGAALLNFKSIRRRSIDLPKVKSTYARLLPAALMVPVFGSMIPQTIVPYGSYVRCCPSGSCHTQHA